MIQCKTCIYKNACDYEVDNCEMYIPVPVAPPPVVPMPTTPPPEEDPSLPFDIMGGYYG